MPIEKLTPSFSFSAERLKELESVVPEAFADGQINWETLRDLLGDSLEDEGAGAEHFGLNWPGKRAARRLAAMPSHGTLAPAPGEGVNEETTSNLFLEGDNLEVLKLLQKSYAGRVKMIYIDPPYNTGNDFIYRDDFSEPLENYLARSGQTNEKGELLTTNPKANGRFHSNWLNMIYPRLRLARTLLRDDGVIFVSIDDNEVHNLREVMNEIFGPENFVAQLVWKKKYTGGKHAKHYVDLHEYILVFAASIECLNEVVMERPDEEKEKFELEDEFVSTRGKHYTRPLKSNLGLRKTLIYPIELPDGSVIETQWLIARDTFDRFFEEKRVIFKQKRDGNYQVYRKYYENDGEGKIKVPSFVEVSSNNDAKVELKNLFNIKEGRDNFFDTAKPTALLKHLFLPILEKNSLVLDFFAGSCSTADAIMQMNKEDNGNRNFILVQIPEATPQDSAARAGGYDTIAEIGKERIRRVIKNLGQQTRIETGETPEDLGFKVFKLAPSNLKQWRENDGKDLQTIGNLFDQFETPLCDDWTPESLLAETMLLEGFPLDSQVSPVEDLQANTMSRVSSPACGHSLFVCFDEKLDPALLTGLNPEATDVFVCLDSALSDDLKLRLGQLCTLKTI